MKRVRYDWATEHVWHTNTINNKNSNNGKWLNNIYNPNIYYCKRYYNILVPKNWPWIKCYKDDRHKIESIYKKEQPYAHKNIYKNVTSPYYNSLIEKSLNTKTMIIFI